MIEHSLVYVAQPWRESAVCSCGVIVAADHTTGGYDGHDGLHFITFDAASGFGGVCQSHDMVDKVCGLPREAHMAGRHEFEPYPGVGDSEVAARKAAQAAEDVYTARPTDAPGRAEEAEEPQDDLDTRYAAARGLPQARPAVSADRALKDARNAALRAGRLHRQQLRRQAGERIRGPRPRGA